jgi:hypothetical protein
MEGYPRLMMLLLALRMTKAAWQPSGSVQTRPEALALASEIDEQSGALTPGEG